MDDFSEAQKLFIEFQNTHKWSVLAEALDILDELVQRDDRKRAENLKGTIDRFMKNEWKQIVEKYNIHDFQSPTNDLLSLLGNSATEDDLERVLGIIGYRVRVNNSLDFFDENKYRP